MHLICSPNICTDKKETNETLAEDGNIGKHNEIRTQVCDDKETAYKCEYS